MQLSINRYILTLAADLRGYLIRDKPIYFLYEAMFTVKTYQQRDWSRKNEYPIVAAK